ncbi:MAG: glycosyltransferase family 4 protein, partial [bacterium]
MNKVLVLAYYFPPYGGGSVIRVTKFVKYLPKFGWMPIILTVDPRYYPNIKDENILNEIRKDIEIYRTPVLEPSGGWAKELKNQAFGIKGGGKIPIILKSIFKKFISSFLIPDKDILWTPYAFRAARNILKRHHDIKIVYATIPRHSTAVIAYRIAQKFGMPLIIDVRDSWVGNPYFEPRSSIRKYIEKTMERKIAEKAERIIVVTEEAKDLFVRKYPYLPNSKFMVLPNGFDEEDFMAESHEATVNIDDKKLNMVYTGNLNVDGGRTPVYLLNAIKELRDEGKAEDLKIFFIGLIHEDYKKTINRLSLRDVVECIDSVPHNECIKYILKADVCISITSYREGAETTIPGKIYEYIRAGKIIFSLSEKDAAVMKLIQENDLGETAQIDNVAEIKRVLLKLINNKKELKIKRSYPEELIKRYN